ncbi:MAG: hypothetical protein Q7L55_02575 [Actinomycetota bacterium]|nr:hypothetical protein [Actinomycetota bacterium]
MSESLITTPAPVAASSSSIAANLPAEVAAFRTSMITQLDSYFKEYGDRLSISERKEMNALQTQVDRELLALQAKTRLTARLEAKNAPVLRRKAAASAAARAFDSTYDRAMAGLEKFQPILQPKLSLFEALSAKSDLDGQLSKFDELGRHIHQFAGN